MEPSRLAWLGLSAAAVAAAAAAARLPFASLPLTNDEAGYAQVARLWARGATLYEDIWVDRPHGLILVFRGLLHIDGGSTEAIRAAAVVAGAAMAVLVLLVANRLAGPRAGVAAGMLAAVAGASPFLESFALNGELLAAIPATAAILAYLIYADRAQTRWLLAAGFLAGCAVMVKQSALDSLFAIALMLVLTERRPALRSVLVLAGAFLVPIVASVASAGSLDAWWYAVVGYRWDGDSLLTHGIGYRTFLLLVSLPALIFGLGFLIASAVLGRAFTPRIVRLWTLGAVVGVLGGGNFHPHYFIQLVPPLAVAGGILISRILDARGAARWLPAGALAATASLSVAMAAPVYLADRRDQSVAIFRTDRALIGEWAATYLDEHSAPGDRVLVVPGEPTVHYLADRPPVTPYLWMSNVQAIPGAIDLTREAVAERHPDFVVVSLPVQLADPTGELSRLLIENYEIVARRGSSGILARRATPRLLPEPVTPAEDVDAEPDDTAPDPPVAGSDPDESVP